MALTTTSIIADTIPTVIEKARLTEQFRAVMPSLCWRIAKKKHNGKTVTVPYFGVVTANGLTEGVDMVNAAPMADTAVTITPAEVGCQIIVTWKVVRDDQEDIISTAGEILGDAMAVKADQDLLGQLDDGTTSLGGAATTLTMGHIAAARALLQGNALASGGPAPGPYVGVTHPFTMLDIVDVVTPVVPAAGTTNVTGTAFTDEILRGYSPSKLFGVTLYEDGNVAISGTDVKGGVFGPKSIIYAVSKDWEVYPEDDASLRATELNIVGEYGVGEFLAGWIVELYNDATTPA